MNEKLTRLRKWVTFYRKAAEKVKLRVKEDQIAESFDKSASDITTAISDLENGKIKFENLPYWIQWRAENEPPS